MRPIDADALKQEWEYIDAIPAVTERDIDNAHTINAIPVEWLEDKMHNSPKELSLAAWRVLNAWRPRDEQEAQDG